MHTVHTDTFTHHRTLVPPVVINNRLRGCESEKRHSPVFDATARGFFPKIVETREKSVRATVLRCRYARTYLYCRPRKRIDAFNARARIWIEYEIYVW